MPNHPNQPQEDDAVLGGEISILAYSAVLGGIEGVKRRLASAVEEQRIAAISQAVNYGDAGLDLVIGALQDESTQVGKTAYLLLKERVEPRVIQALKEYNPWEFFECLRTLGRGDVFSVTLLAISPDGKTIVSGSEYGNGNIKVWNLQTGELLKTLYENSFLTLSFAISPDGKTICSGNRDKTIKVWNLQTGELLRTLQG